LEALHKEGKDVFKDGKVEETGADKIKKDEKNNDSVLFLGFDSISLDGGLELLTGCSLESILSDSN
jgi:hypothetical protein